MLWLVSTARHPRERTLRLLLLYLTYSVVEVAIKRFGHFSWTVYPLKFVLLFSVYLSWAGITARRRLPLASVPFAGVLGAYLALAALQIFNPIQANPLVGAAGWLSDFAFVPFYFVAFHLFDDVRSMRRFMYATAALGVLSAAACLGEQWYGPDELMRQYPAFVHLLYFTGSTVVHRPALLSPYNEVFAIAAIVGLLQARKGSMVLLAAAIALCVVANILHVVRIGWFTGLVTIALLSLLNSRRRMINVALVAASIVLAVNVGMTVTDGQIADALNSATTPVRTFEEKRLWGVQAIPLVMADYPFGVGVGGASPGVRFLNADGVTSFGTHNYLADLTGQMSILGPILLIIFSIRVAASVLRDLRASATQDEWRAQVSFAFAMFGALALSLFGGGGLGSSPVSDYFWLTTGAAMGLTYARRREAARAREVITSRRPGPMLVPRAALARRKTAS